jgi:hypothetical protein
VEGGEGGREGEDKCRKLGKIEKDLIRLSTAVSISKTLAAAFYGRRRMHAQVEI